MKAISVAVLVLILAHYADAKDLKGDLLITSQLNEWCMSSKPMKQQFCEAYLYGVYETTDCKFRIATPPFSELRTTFVTWVFAMKDDAFVYAVESAAAAFKRKYGCN